MKNKYYFLILLHGFITLEVYSQCNIKTSIWPNDIAVNYLNPEMVGKGTGCEIGLSVMASSTDYYLNTAVLYFTKPVKSIGSLIIELSNNQSLNLELYASELATINGAEISGSVYILTETDLEKLKKTTIKKIIFKEATGRSQIIILSKNFDVASRHINCLNKQ